MTKTGCRHALRTVHLQLRSRYSYKSYTSCIPCSRYNLLNNRRHPGSSNTRHNYTRTQGVGSRLVQPSRRLKGLLVYMRQFERDAP